MNLTSNSHTLLPTLQNPLFISLKTNTTKFTKQRKHTKRLNLSVRNNIASTNPFEGLFNSLVSTFPSINSLDLLGPVLGLASGLALHTARLPFLNRVRDYGEWVLFTSPTPFNRFVLLRCPSVSGFIEGGGIAEKLVKEDRHYVRLSSGRIKVGEGAEYGGELLEYQRVCLRAEDGGVISLDWPVNLDLEEEHGFDTTVLLVPGSTEGSMDRCVKEFVVEAMRCGLFPVVMNPRGCAGSALTTPRLFTAADSDDVSTAVQFINKARPWTTLMSVGWGYGANMLTKYLAEAGEQTPLTAATCIDNPFDLEDAARASQYNIDAGNKFTSGLVDILRSNKELFQGRARGYDVEKALLAKSLRDFEEAISMVSYGFETLEEFYSKSSTRSVVGKLQIPVLFIQNNDGRVPLLSVPRSLIAENPYTSLLFCSCLPSSVIENDINVLSWSRSLTIEWLTAVELGLLKGRHPFLKDVDVTINPSRSLTLLEGRASQEKERSGKYLDLSQSNSLNGYSINTVEEIVEDDNAIGFSQDAKRKPELEGKGLQEVSSGKLKQNNAVDAEVVKGNETAVKDGERGEVLHTAQVVMNVLDVTIPGTLSENDKKKVLTAVGQGETVMKALQDAVPEDVRGKLTSAVSGIMNAQGSNVNFGGLQRMAKLPNVSSNFKSKVHEEANGISDGEGPNHDNHHVSDKLNNSVTNNSDNSQVAMEKLPRGSESEAGPSEKLQKSIDRGQTHSSNQEEETSSSVMTVAEEAGNNYQSEGYSTDKGGSYSEFSYKEPETATKPSLSKPPGKGGPIEEAHDYEYKADQDHGVTQPSASGNQIIQKNDSKSSDVPSDQSKSTSNNKIEETPPLVGSSPEPEQTESERNNSQKMGNETLQPASDLSINQNKSAPGSKMGETAQSAGSSSEPQPTEGEIIDNQKCDPQNRQPAQEQNNPTESDRNDNQKTENKTSQPVSDYSYDQNKSASSSKMEENTSSVGSSSENQPTEGESNDNLKKNPQNVQPSQEQNNSGASDSKPPDFSVSQALGALAGIDDSTQVAVNSVFGVIESMINQYEEGNNNENQVKEESDAEKNDSVSAEQRITDDQKLEENVQGDECVQSDTFDDPPRYNHSKIDLNSNSNNEINGGWIEEPSQNHNSFDWDHTDSLSGNKSTTKFCEYEDYNNGQSVGNNLLGDYSDETSSSSNIPSHMGANHFADAPKNEYLSSYLPSKTSRTKPLDIDTTTAVFLDYLPEEGQWTLLEHSGKMGDSSGDIAVQKGAKGKGNAHTKGNDKDSIIEPPYVILDTEKQEDSLGSHGMDIMAGNGGDNCSDELKFFVKNIILEALKVEASRRLGVANAKRIESTLARDVERVAIAVSWTIGQEIEQNTFEANDHGKNCNLAKFGSVGAEQIIRAIMSAVQETYSLRRVLPVGVIIGSSLVALRKYFNVTSFHNTEKKEDKAPEKIHDKSHGSTEELNQISSKRPGQNMMDVKKESKLKNLNDSVMVGAVTAAIGASALLAQQQDAYVVNPTTESSSSSYKEKRDPSRETNRHEEPLSERNQNNVMSSLAEKAMSVAAPVVPTKDSGGLDIDRLVAMLADLGQRGGMLTLVGKLALLWGGLRGAMSLTDRLIAFLRIADRPLPQRILGFVGLVLVLWSPVVVPLLPALVQSWTSNASSRFADLACIFGLYAAVMILIVLWGKRVRGYKNPLVQYGLDLTSKPKIANLLKGLSGGIMLVSVIHVVNVLLGCAVVSWPLKSPLSSLNIWTWLKFFGRMLMLGGKGIVVSSTIALVEELVFRSWLLEEIAADIGHHHGIILSAIGFALFQRSPQSFPGLLLFSLGQAGARERSNGSLSVPIGIHAGMLASTSIIQNGGFILYKHNFPNWVAGTQPFQPFSGVVGIAFALLFALTLYPRQPFHWKKWQRIILD